MDLMSTKQSQFSGQNLLVSIEDGGIKGTKTQINSKRKWLNVDLTPEGEKFDLQR